MRAVRFAHAPQRRLLEEGDDLPAGRQPLCHAACRLPRSGRALTRHIRTSTGTSTRSHAARAHADGGSARRRRCNKGTRRAAYPHRPHLLRQLSQRIAACACVARRDGGGVAARVRVRAVVGQRPPLGPGAGDDAAVLCIWRALFGTERPRRQPMAFNGSLRVLWVLWGILGHLWYSRVL